MLNSDSLVFLAFLLGLFDIYHLLKGASVFLSHKCNSWFVFVSFVFGVLIFFCFLFCLFCFVFCLFVSVCGFFFSETEFLCIAMDVLELTL